MKIRLGLILGLVALFITGCATVPQQSVQFSHASIRPDGGKIGVAMTQVGAPGISFPGADCLLCIAAASLMNSSLSVHTKTLTPEDVPNLKNEVAELLRKNGANVTLIEEPLNVQALKGASNKGSNIADKDFGPLAQKYGVDKLLVIEVNAIGFVRTYSAYIPTSDPLAKFYGRGYLVNLKNNEYEWYQPLEITRSADLKWDEPPKFPGLTNAYYQALENGKDLILNTFRNNPVATMPAVSGNLSVAVNAAESRQQ